MKNTLLTLKVTFIQFIIFCSFSTFGQCDISSLTVEMTACEEELFDVSLDFEHENTSDQFTVSINSVDYGTYNYEDLPITVTSIDTDCMTEYVFVVTDVEDEDCSEDVLLPLICCDEECEIIDLVLTTSECDGQVFNLTIDFDFMWGTSSTFDWEIPGLTGGSAYFWEIPLTVQITDNGSDILGFVVNMTGNNNCAAETSFENPCVDASCFIGVVFVEILDCVEDQFGVSIDFQYNNTSDQFTVAGNGNNYGTYSYEDLPITIDGLDGDCMTEYEFVVTDVNDNDCSNFAELGTVCCNGAECDLFDLVIETTECDGTEFGVTFDFEYTGTTNNFFDWEIPGVSSGFAEFSDLPLTVGVNNTSIEVLSLIINENDNPNCAIDGTFENPCFDPADCFIGELNIDVSECDGNEFFVVINFEYENTSDEFFVNANGNNYGPFSYNNLPVTIEGLESNCDVPYEFQVYDSELNGTCTSDANIGIICCDNMDCEIVSIDFGANPECVEGFIVTEWFIFGENTSEVGYDIFINDEFYTFVQYNGNGPYDFDIEDPGTENFTIKACDNDNPDCCFTWELMNPCFEEEECDLFDLVIETSECDGGLFEVTFDFEYTGTTNAFFDWEIPGYSSGFAEFSDLPVTVVVQNTGMNGFDLFINENDNPNCAIEGSFENPCFAEECFIGELNVDVSECDGNMFFVVINFEYENTSDQFTVNGNGNSYGTFSYEDLPITIDGLESDCNLIYEFVVHDVNNNDCASDIDIGEVCCEGDCDMTALDFFANPICEDGLIVTEWLIAGENVSEVGYDIFINDVFELFVQYNESDIYDFEIEDPGTEYFTIKACDNDNADCCITIEVMNPCFDPAECDLFDLVIETSECDGGFFEVVFDFEYTGTTNNFFDWEISGYSSGFAEFSQLPLSVLIQNSDMNGFDLFINENDNPNCAIEGSFENPCFEPDECFIGELEIDVSDCNDNMFFVVIDFDYANTSDEFFVNSNGNNYGPFMYSNLPVTIDGFESNCDVPYEFLVYDSEQNGTCESDANIGIVCCDEENCFIGELDVEVSECDGNFFFVVINFEYENTSNQFTVAGNGNSYGTYSYDDLPITIDGLESDCDLDYEFVVIDAEFQDCASDVGIGEVCCDEEECDLFDLVIETSECDGGVFTITFDFEYTGTTNNFFNWEIPGYSSGTAEFSDLPVTLTIQNTNEEVYELIINENDNEDCIVEGSFENPCFETEDCFIGELNVELSECDGNFFFVVINFEYENTSNQFTVAGNGNNYGTYSYADLPITIDGLESDCDLDVEFVVIDAEFQDCASDIGIGEVCCDEDECDLFDLNFEVSECDGDYFVVEVDFEYTGNTNESFIWEIPGIGSGTEAFANLPISIEIENSTEPQFTFFANEVENPDCDIVGTFGNPCYDSDECFIDAVTAVVIACEDDLFDVEIDFEYDNVGSTFSIVGNGVEYGTFEYSDLPVVITSLEADCQLEYEFVIMDNDNEGCSDFVEIGTICCEDFNQISGLQSETIIVEEIFNITFDIANTTLKGCNIQVYIDGELFETLEDNESLFTVGPFDCGQEGIIEIKLVNSCSDAEWVVMFDLSEISCTTDVNVTLDSIDLIWNMIHKTLTLDGEVPVSVNVQLINAQGALILAENGVKIGWNRDLNNYPSGLYFVRIVDNDSYTGQGLIKKILIH